MNTALKFYLTICVVVVLILSTASQAQILPEYARPFTTSSTDKLLYTGPKVWLTACAYSNEFTIIFQLSAEPSETIKLKASRASDWPGNCVTRIASGLTLQGTLSSEARGWYAFDLVSRLDP